MTQLKSFIQNYNIAQVEVGRAIEMDETTLSHKLAGRRPWFQHEIDAVLAFLSERLGRPVTYEEAFASQSALPAVVNQ